MTSESEGEFERKESARKLKQRNIAIRQAKYRGNALFKKEDEKKTFFIPTLGRGVNNFLDLIHPYQKYYLIVYILFV